MQTHRFEALDALRGLAILWMTLFHFCFDLNQFGHIAQNFYQDPFWTWQRTLIVSLFLLCAGAGQAIAVAQGQTWMRFWRRWAQVLGCAVLVTAGSWLMYPNSFIYFGVLHGLAVMLIVARVTASWGRWLWLLGGLAMASKFIGAGVLDAWAANQVVHAFNSPALNWLGWITHKPLTEDYLPIFPWLGVVWWGVALGQVLAGQITRMKAHPLPRALQPLAKLGRWSLPYYMVHQPVLIGGLMAVAWLQT